jgi:hypothetical protein
MTEIGCILSTSTSYIRSIIQRKALQPENSRSWPQASRVTGTDLRYRVYEDVYYLINKYAPYEDGVGPQSLRPSGALDLQKGEDSVVESDG